MAHNIAYMGIQITCRLRTDYLDNRQHFSTCLENACSMCMRPMYRCTAWEGKQGWAWWFWEEYVLSGRIRHAFVRVQSYGERKDFGWWMMNYRVSNINTSYQKLPFGCGDDPDKFLFHQALRVCLNFIRRSWNGWNGTTLFVVVRSIPTCFQVFVSIPTTKRNSWNSCELSAIGDVLDCQYKTLL